MSTTPFKAGGALTDQHATVYVERQADHDVLSHVRMMDYLLIIEPRQQGKTSLINHLMRHSALGNMTIAYVDMTTPDRSTQATWYRTVCPRILRQLSGFLPREQWPAIPKNSAGWREFLCEIAVSAADADQRVLIALDEIGAVVFSGATDFFSVLRDVYNSRQAETELKQLTFLLSGAFHPRDLIQDDRVSPFNIAQRVRLADFAPAQIRELVGKGNWRSEQANALSERIHYWTDGQPYLTQLLCSYLGQDATPADVDVGLECLRCEDENHLPPMLERLYNDEKLRRYTDRILAGERTKFYPREHRRQAQLELLGVLKEGPEGYCVVRNRIYQRVLAESAISSSPSLKEEPARETAASSLIAGEGMDYNRGLEALKAQVVGTNRREGFTTLEARLLGILKEEDSYGATEYTRSERTRAVTSLNKLALEVLGLSFNDLARGQVPASGQVSVRDLSMVHKLAVTLSPLAINPPVQPRLQDLPFNELSWEQFEAVCAALIEAQPLAINCNLYGVQGDDQQGIDVVAKQRGAEGDETWAYQCKRYKTYTTGKLEKALDDMEYDADYYVLMLSIPANAALRKIVDARPNAFLWDAKDIARKLKNFPAIVEDFFGTAWRQAFCG